MSTWDTTTALVLSTVPNEGRVGSTWRYPLIVSCVWTESALFGGHALSVCDDKQMMVNDDVLGPRVPWYGIRGGESQYSEFVHSWWTDFGASVDTCDDVGGCGVCACVGVVRWCTWYWDGGSVRLCG